MFGKRAPRFMLAAAAVITAATAFTAVGVTASGATSTGTHALPRLNAPGLHPRSTAASPATDACNYHAAIPADRFKGVPVFDATEAAQPMTSDSSRRRA